MNLLAIEASHTQGSVTVLDENGAVLWDSAFNCGRQRTGEIFSEVRNAVSKVASIDRVVVGLGPGSYSGIRQSIALAQGYCRGAGAQLAGLASACGVSDAARFQVFGDARRGAYYFTRVENGAVTEGPRLLEKVEVEEKIAEVMPSFCTEALPTFSSLLLSHPRAFLLASAAWKQWEAIRSNPVEPFYLREPNITAAKNPPRLA